MNSEAAIRSLIKYTTILSDEFDSIYLQCSTSHFYFYFLSFLRYIGKSASRIILRIMNNFQIFV